MTESVKQWILKHKLENYGYDWKDFNRMSSYKSRVFKKLKNTPEKDVRKALAQAGILGKGKRLNISRSKRTGEKYWDYTTGQSFNEEIINIATVGASKGKKNFWDVQDRWFR